MSSRKSIKVYLLVAAILNIVWGLVPSASKIVIDEIPVELYVALRWTISGVFFAIFLMMTGRWKRVNPKDLVMVGSLGVLGYGIASLATLYGLKIGGVTNFVLIAAFSPVITSLVAIIFLSEKPGREFFMALPFAVAGLVLVAVGKYQISSLSVAVTGALLIMVAYVLEALVFVFSKRFKDRMPSSQYLALSQITAAGFMWIMQLATLHQTGQLAQLTHRGIFAVLFVSVVACVLCYSVLYWLLNYIDGHKLAMFEGLHAVSGAFFGYVLFNEEISSAMFLGGTLILLALVISQFPKASPPEEPVSI